MKKEVELWTRLIMLFSSGSDLDLNSSEVLSSLLSSKGKDGSQVLGTNSIPVVPILSKTEWSNIDWNTGGNGIGVYKGE